MAKKKKIKWPYKFLTPEDVQAYKELPLSDLVEKLKEKVAYLDEKKKEKRGSEALKDLRSEIKEYRERWSKNDELEEAKAVYDSLKNERDAHIDDLLEDKKSLEGGLSDQVKGCEEHRDAMLYALRFHKSK